MKFISTSVVIFSVIAGALAMPKVDVSIGKPNNTFALYSEISSLVSSFFAGEATATNNLTSATLPLSTESSFSTTDSSTDDLPMDLPTDSAGLPTDELPTDLPTDELPTDDLPTDDLPTDDLPTEALPTDDLSTETDTDAVEATGF